jgi:hypothetical protein
MNGTNGKTRHKDMELYEGTQAVIGDIVLLVMTKGAYVGVYHNYTYGLNFKVMYEDSSEVFYASNPFELGMLKDELEEWIRGLGDKPRTTKTRNGPKKP